MRNDPEVLRGPVAESLQPPATLWTIGHSTHPIDEFLALLAAHDIQRIADVRRFAGSRKYPQFNPDALAVSLADAGVGYTPCPALGGRRRPRPDSPHTAWRNEAFRGYADYMDTPEFREAAAELATMAPLPVAAAPGHATHRMAQRGVPRLRGLHGYVRVP